MINATHHEQAVMREISKYPRWTPKVDGQQTLWFSSPGGAHIVPSTIEPMIRKGLITMKPDGDMVLFEITEAARD